MLICALKLPVHRNYVERFALIHWFDLVGYMSLSVCIKQHVGLSANRYVMTEVAEIGVMPKNAYDRVAYGV